MSASSSFAMPAPAPANAHTGRARLIVVATVLGWNALAMAALWIWAVATSAKPSAGSEDWSGVVTMIVVSIMTLAILTSTAIGVTVALVRSGRPGWLRPASPTGKLVLAGTRAAAWGLCAIAAIPVLVVLLGIASGA